MTVVRTATIISCTTDRLNQICMKGRVDFFCGHCTMTWCCVSDCTCGAVCIVTAVPLALAVQISVMLVCRHGGPVLLQRPLGRPGRGSACQGDEASYFVQNSVDAASPRPHIASALRLCRNSLHVAQAGLCRNCTGRCMMQTTMTFSRLPARMATRLPTLICQTQTHRVPSQILMSCAWFARHPARVGIAPYTDNGACPPCPHTTLRRRPSRPSSLILLLFLLLTSFLLV